MSDLITHALVRLDADLGTEKHDVIRALADIVATHLQLRTKLARAAGVVAGAAAVVLAKTAWPVTTDVATV